MSSPLTADQREQLTRTLSAWEVPREAITEILADGVFAAGVLGIDMGEAGLPNGVGIMIDAARDPELEALFERRSRLTDEQLVADFTVESTEAEVLLCPYAREAMLAYTVQINTPWRIRRTFLLLISKRPDVYGWLAEPGTTVWLLPTEAGVREWAREGLGTGYDVLKDALPVGHTPGGSQIIDWGVRHVLGQPA